MLQEQTEVAEQFARLIASNQLSTDDVKDILDEHAHSVHLLRMRQRDERQRLLARLDAKRGARRTTADDDDDDDKNGDEHEMPKVPAYLRFNCCFQVNLGQPVPLRFSPSTCSEAKSMVIDEKTLEKNKRR